MRSLLSYLHCYSFKFVFGVVSIAVLLGLPGCTAPALYTFTEYVTEEDYAASKIGLEGGSCSGFLGKQIVINWSLPKKYHSVSFLSLLLEVYYNDGEHDKVAYEIRDLSGYKVYRASQDKDFDSDKEIVSYKVCLVADGKEIVVSTHHLWTEIIPITRGNM